MSRIDYLKSKFDIDWLREFADSLKEKYPVNKTVASKKKAVDDKVKELRQRVGLDMLDTLEKEGKFDSNLPISQAQEEKQEETISNELKDAIKIYVKELLNNRNGHITNHGLLDLISQNFGIDLDIIMKAKEELFKMFEEVKSGFTAQTQKSFTPQQLAAVDTPPDDSREKKI